MKVTLENYQELAERTSATSRRRSISEFSKIGERFDSIRLIRLLHAGSGLTTEAGEFMDALKQHVFYGKDLDEDNLAEEIGDVLWYCAEVLNALGVSFEDVMTSNIRKLQALYPKKFTQENALNRDLEKEKNALKNQMEMMDGIQDSYNEIDEEISLESLSANKDALNRDLEREKDALEILSPILTALDSEVAKHLAKTEDMTDSEKAEEEITIHGDPNAKRPQGIIDANVTESHREIDLDAE